MLRLIPDFYSYVKGVVILAICASNRTKSVRLILDGDVSLTKNRLNRKHLDAKGARHLNYGIVKEKQYFKDKSVISTPVLSAILPKEYLDRRLYACILNASIPKKAVKRIERI